jgi:dTDP-4-dehydrorhamnose 3,5-epimerase
MSRSGSPTTLDSGHPLYMAGVRVIVPPKFGDDRGFFSETYSASRLAEHGITDAFIQDNHSWSRDVGTVRGLHFQTPPYAQAKLVRVTRGRLVDIVVDIRRASPTFGQHVAIEISAAAWNQIYVPIGFAHGLCTLEPDTEVVYKVTAPYAAAHDKGILWNDPALGIDWPVAADAAVLSAKDKVQPRLADLPDYF